MKYISLIVFFTFFGSQNVFATKIAYKIDPFFARVEKAEIVALVEAKAFEKADSPIPELADASKEYFELASLKVLKVWKGKIDQKKILNVYYLSSKYSEEVRVRSELFGRFYTGKPDPTMSYIFYIRKMNGKFVVATEFGMIPFSNKSRLENHKEKRALDAMESGKSQEEINKILNER